MKHLVVLSLTAFCAAFGAGCAHSPQAPALVASMPPPKTATHESERAGARLDAKWLSAIVGMPVESSSGAKLGRVQDVVADGYGRPTFAILSYGAWVAGFGARYVAVPWDTVAEMLDRDKLVVNLQVMESAPTLASAGADARSGDWRRDSERYWKGKVASAQ